MIAWVPKLLNDCGQIEMDEAQSGVLMPSRQSI
jgi:hypothetical protein